MSVTALVRNIDRAVTSVATRARVFILFGFHAAVFTIAYVFATMLRFDFRLGPDQIERLFHSSLPFVVGLQLLVGVGFGFYRGWWRYVGMSEILRMVGGMTISLGLLISAWYILPMGDRLSVTGISRGVLVIDWAFAILALFGVRVLVRIARDRMRNEYRSGDVKRVMIIGAGDAGEALAREIEHRPQMGMKVVGFVDDHEGKCGSYIRGIRVRGPISSIATIGEECRATEALIAIPSASGKRMREIIQYLSEADLDFRTIPGVDQLVSGKVQVSQLRPVNIDDLLRREEIVLPGDPVRALFKGKRVMVTGAGGTIGSELATQILAFEPAHVALVERSEYALYQSGRRLSKEHGRLAERTSRHLVDIRNSASLNNVIENVRPEIVLHAAAHKHVPLGEENPTEYVLNNCLATRRVAEICEAHGVERFVFISTDKAINPTSVMGASKRAGEIALMDFAARSRMKISAVRFGNVLGSSGSVIPLFLEQIAEGGPVTVTHPEVTRYFLRTSEAVSLVLQAATLSNGGNVFMLDMGEPVKIADLARDLIELSNHEPDEIEIVFTGLRPGEKLFEEVRLQGERNHPTQHPQIVVTEAPQPDTMVVTHWMRRFDSGSAVKNRDAVAALVDLIPEYSVSDQYRDVKAPRLTPALNPISGVARLHATESPT
ncbi:MAG: nucleoside-diphosphate sugar epimerase/dehydratase [Thermoanaerobaculia bacterium]